MTSNAINIQKTVITALVSQWAWHRSLEITVKPIWNGMENANQEPSGKGRRRIGGGP